MRKVDIKNVKIAFMEKTDLDEQTIQEIIDNMPTKKEERPMKAFFEVEDWLYGKKEKPIDTKSAMLWGALFVVHKMGCIDWETMKSLYGEFMSHQMDLV